MRTATSPVFSISRLTGNCWPLRRASPFPTTTPSIGRPGIWIGTRSRLRREAYVSGPAKIRVVEKGPARVAVEVSRETAGSRFVQTIRLSAGEAGKRVEFANAIDWNTRESNLKATFPLTASNQMATYNWDIGTIERPTAEPKKFEVPSHQWIDLTDMSGEFGATILTDCKNGSDKPNDHTIRLTLNSNSRHSRWLCRPGHAGYWASRVHLWHCRACRRLAAEPD